MYNYEGDIVKVTFKKLLYIFLSIIVLTGCSCKKEEETGIIPQTKHVSEEIFGTDVSFTMYNKKELKKVFPKVEEFLKKAYYSLDREMFYDGVNNLATINSNYGSGQEIVVDRVLYDALKLGVELSILTDGYFNIGAGALSDIWEYYYFYDEDGTYREGERFSKYGFVKEDPSTSLINAALACTPTVSDYENMLEFNDETRGVKFNAIPTCTNNRVYLTLGALGKGFAIEEAKKYASTLTDEVFFINAGNSSIVTNGINPLKERDTWNVSVQSPYPYTQGINTLYTFNVGFPNSMAISTSGDTEKYYFLDDGNEGYVLDDYGLPLKRHHIINPKTGFPESYWNVLTFYSSTRADILDALTTAAYSIPTIEGIEELINEIEQEYNINIDYAIQRAKMNEETDESYVSVWMSDYMQDCIISYKTYMVLENKKEEGE